ncbi:unnamed protein product [Ambrosiozyma monospora]|uniref:Unnamed protein product n=1 Tax=Ambrosiozyma monospora TaxID=43982 RepID=A0ACB5UEL1_AMBMO|nr:unnamed protein product [Ambrosiozyma monospora]
MKKSTNAKFNKQLSNLVDKLNANSKFIEQKRSTIEYGPSNKAEVAKFLQDIEWDKTPLGAYVATQRAVKEAKLKVLRESLAAAEEEEKNKKDDGSDDEELDAEDMEVDSEDEE